MAPIIHSIILFSNGMAAAFDKRQAIIAGLEGSIINLRKKLPVEDVPLNCEFYFAQWGVNMPDLPDDQKVLVRMNREQFYSPAWIPDKSEYDEGYKDGLTSFAWWKDGAQVVGTSETKLSKAIETRKESPYYNKERI